MFYELKEGTLVETKTAQGNYDLGQVLGNKYLEDIDSEKSVIVDTYNNRCFLISKDLLKNGVSEEVYQKMLESNESDSTQSSEEVTFILTITYKCNSLFDFSYENLTNYQPVAITCNSYAECKDCKIGGFCGGGCQLSHQIDFKKCCEYEEEVFSHFMKTLFIPYIKSKYNEVNQSDRKTENGCT